MKKPNNYRPLLAVDKDAKTRKGDKQGYLTAIMYLSPANESGVTNVCTSSTQGCRESCLFTAGYGRYDTVFNGRVNKTLFMVNDPVAFRDSLRYDIQKWQSKATKQGRKFCVRINGTSDLPKLASELAREFPTVQFYDYTKHPKPYLRTLPNYDITFSLSESNTTEALDVLQHGINVAIVFNTLKTEALPEQWNGYKVVDGDVSDLRFLDPKGVVVGLRAKGEAKKDTSGFVQIVDAK